MYDAAVVYNSGETSRLPILSPSGSVCRHVHCIDIDRKRVVEDEKQITEAA